ncbi:MAG: hypothetical protein ACKO3K_12435 [Cuspidothrix sp.]
MRPIKKWVEYPLVEVRGIYVEEGECRLLEGYVVQRYQEGDIFLFSEIADLMQYEVESAEQKLKNNVIDVAAQSIVGGIFGAMFGGRTGAEIGSHLGALGAASETIVEISLIQSGSHRLRLIVDPSAINLLESIFNGSFKRSATILSINSNLKQQQKDEQKAALGCLGIIGGVILLIVIIGLLLGASKSPQLDKSPQSEDQSSLNNQKTLAFV